MTNKRRKMAHAVAEGKSIEEAAKIAGYNLPYARKVAREPAFEALVERFRDRAASSAGDRDAVERLWEIINDPAVDEAQRISAVRALIAYDRAHADKPATEPVVIIDDIPPTCENCPRTGKDFTGGQDDERITRTDPPADKRGPGEDLPGSSAVPADG